MQYVATVGLSLVFLVLFANLLVDLYARGAVRDALDEGVRAAAPAGADTNVCEARAQEVLDGLLHGRLGDDIRVQCRARRLDDGRARRKAALPSWLPASFRRGTWRSKRGCSASHERATRTTRSERGFVAVEWVAAIACPDAARRRPRRDAAELGRAAARGDRRRARSRRRRGRPCDGRSRSRASGSRPRSRQNYGIDAADVDVRVRAGAARGEYVTVDVSVRMPAIAVPGVVQAGGWTYTATQHRRLDDYRSR